jgi:hypothetical protein
MKYLSFKAVLGDTKEGDINDVEGKLFYSQGAAIRRKFDRPRLTGKHEESTVTLTLNKGGSLRLQMSATSPSSADAIGSTDALICTRHQCECNTFRPMQPMWLTDQGNNAIAYFDIFISLQISTCAFPAVTFSIS